LDKCVNLFCPCHAMDISVSSNDNQQIDVAFDAGFLPGERPKGGAGSRSRTQARHRLVQSAYYLNPGRGRAEYGRGKDVIAVERYSNS
jgi:hypothetical protein